MSIFLDVPQSSWVASNELAFAIRDSHPVSEGHTLVVPRRVVATWFEATAAERQAIWDLVDRVKEWLDRELAPDGYNVGFDAGVAAGQTVKHLAVHVVPRYRYETADRPGGMRHTVPGEGRHLPAPPRPRHHPLVTGGADDPLLAHLRPLMARATSIQVVVAFVQDRGLALLEDSLFDALRRGCAVRLLTGDYLQITQAEALNRLLDWERESQAMDDEPDGDAEEHRTSTLETRVIEVQRLAATSFHPKAWLLEGIGFGSLFVGSSNISEAALRTGVEWNLKTDSFRDPVAWAAALDAFEGLWQQGRSLDPEWIAAYAGRARAVERPAAEDDEEPEAPLPPPEPNPAQTRALEALALSRTEGHRRALVVMATGLGKTLLAAFDVRAFADAGARGPVRVLFLAHRAELLRQAAGAFRRLMPEARFGWFAGTCAEMDGEVVFASVAKLSRPSHLEELDPRRFDYVIVDEVHHAAAASYRRILAHLEPDFLLGLTATPDRADEADVLGLFDDHLPYRADLGEGIESGMLVPFQYFGVRDTVDYQPIPWRNRRFDPAVLAEAVQTRERMESLWGPWQEHVGQRSIVFCCSIAHADFVQEWLAERGVHAEAIHTGPGSADRSDALERLGRGELQALCAVDLLNEGIDVPTVDRVVMLRPTESPVIFLQQLGRGLRTAPEKTDLTVIDFVGNHRVFLDRLRCLLSLVGRTAPPLRGFLKAGEAPELPYGCSIEIELEAIDLLRRLLPAFSVNEAVRVYRDLRAAREERPTTGELQRLQVNPRSVSMKTPGGWFGFVAAEGDLTPAEREAFEAGEAWFIHLETRPMKTCFDMVVLEVLIETDALADGLPADELARRSHDILRRTPALFRDIEGVKNIGHPAQPDPAAWLAYWRDNPVSAWSSERWFDLAPNGRLVPRLPFPQGQASRDAFIGMTQELVDLRLAQYRARDSEPSGAGFEGKLISNKRDPIIKIPSAGRHPDRPTGPTDVRLPDGSTWQFNLVKEYCNVARPVGTQRNRLPDLLRGWFGPSAGQPGTEHRVRFYRSPDGWWIEPLGVDDEASQPTGLITAYPDLRAAAGAATGLSQEQAVEPWPVRLPGGDGGEDLFAVRATGDSMDGGSEPICDGDWVILRWARGDPLGRVEGRVALVETRADDSTQGPRYQLKRPVPEGRGFELRSDNPTVPPQPAGDTAQVIAVRVLTVRPESLAPTVGKTLDRDGIAPAFHLTETPHGEQCRRDGHLFLQLKDAAHLPAPDRVDLEVVDRRPGETAYALLKLAENTWRYCGVARWREAEGRWAIPALDYEIWRALKGGRGASRTLDSEWTDAASALVETLLLRFEPGDWVEHAERRCRIEGRASKGGFRISGGPDGFQVRTISLVDLGWALYARSVVHRDGGQLDESRVNRERYLEGTPKGATRWIDTGWALFLLGAMGGGGS